MPAGLPVTAYGLPVTEIFITERGVKLFAISDLHAQHGENWAALQQLPPYPDDWLIVAGDVAETTARFEAVIALLTDRFTRVIWTPGNHDLWTMPQEPELRGEEKYTHLVEICRRHGALTPEDAYARWPGGAAIAPVFTLYDYSFRPPEVALETAVAWAGETGISCADELLLHPTPYPSRQAWCAARVRHTEAKLATISDPIILVNHFTLRQDLLRLRRIPRFSLWCGTTLTANWHTRYPIQVVIYGHLHMRGTHFRQGVRYEEVSLGYPRQWHVELGIGPYLRQILPDV